jgi:hypothetical protein
MPSGDCFLFADEDGLIKPVKDLGDSVHRGTVLVRIHPIDRTGRSPAEYSAAIDGILAGRHFPGLVKSGDCIAVIGAPVAPPCAAATTSRQKPDVIYRVHKRESCVSACKKDPLGGVIGVQKGPL